MEFGCIVFIYIKCCIWFFKFLNFDNCFLIQFSFWYTKYSAFLNEENLGTITVTSSNGFIRTEIFFALLLF